MRKRRGRAATLPRQAHWQLNVQLLLRARPGGGARHGRHQGVFLFSSSSRLVQAAALVVVVLSQHRVIEGV